MPSIQRRPVWKRGIVKSEKKKRGGFKSGKKGEGSCYFPGSDNSVKKPVFSPRANSESQPNLPVRTGKARGERRLKGKEGVKTV